MKIQRTLVRMISHRTGEKTHRFLYGDKANKAAEIELAIKSMEHDLSYNGPVDLANELQKKLKLLDGKEYGSYHHEGWLVMIRRDMTEQRITDIVSNDNQPSVSDDRFAI